jgi:uncharacterized protein with PQ loop repeat
MSPLMTLTAADALSWQGVIAWSFLLTNGARLITYLPQILAVWRCQDGARALSLITWTSWVVSHVTALLYGAVVLHDPFFVVVSLINLVCSAIVVVIAGHRRGLWGRGHAGPSAGTDAWEHRSA